ncbi:hypothetical protein D3C71_1360480 [compost metagenome]
MGAVSMEQFTVSRAIPVLLENCGAELARACTGDRQRGICVSPVRKRDVFRPKLRMRLSMTLQQDPNPGQGCRVPTRRNAGPSRQFAHGLAHSAGIGKARKRHRPQRPQSRENPRDGNQQQQRQQPEPDDFVRIGGQDAPAAPGLERQAVTPTARMHGDSAQQQNRHGNAEEADHDPPGKPGIEAFMQGGHDVSHLAHGRLHDTGRRWLKHQ